MRPGSPRGLVREILDSQPGLVIVALDTEYRYLAFNENHRATMARIWGADIEVGMSMLDYVGRVDDRERAKANFDRALAGEAFTLTEAYGDENTGERRYYRDAYAPMIRDGQVVGLTIFLTDVTEQRRVELALEAMQSDLESLAQRRSAEMLHAQKLESLGVLAGGIAHDFNNILAIIIGAADLAGHYLTQPEQLTAEIGRIQRGAQRAAELTNQMLSYAGRAERRPERISLRSLIIEMFELLGATVSGRAAMEADMASDCPDIVADASQIRQVVMNLLTNASDAVSDGGRVIVRVRRDARPDGVFALLEVEDEGVGMDADTIERIFDPFFTTKFQGRGLGLAAVQGIIVSHGGHLEVRSEVGKGSVFRVWLPSVPRGGLIAMEPKDPTLDGDAPRHVLVVDDQPEVLELCVSLLQSAGVNVSTASEGKDALAILGAKPDIDVVLLDLTMPGPTPEHTIEALRALRPSVPIVVFSGYDEGEVRTRLGDQINGFVRKPFRRAVLLGALANAMEPTD
ncbi:MAG: ATP-binding protein [Myxococcota bacterium]